MSFFVLVDVLCPYLLAILMAQPGQKLYALLRRIKIVQRFVWIPKKRGNMMYCKKCGKENSTGMAFCKQCGSALTLPGSEAGTNTATVSTSAQDGEEPVSEEQKPHEASLKQRVLLMETVCPTVLLRLVCVGVAILFFAKDAIQGLWFLATFWCVVTAISWYFLCHRSFMLSKQVERLVIDLGCTDPIAKAFEMLSSKETASLPLEAFELDAENHLCLINTKFQLVGRCQNSRIIFIPLEGKGLSAKGFSLAEVHQMGEQLAAILRISVGEAAASEFLAWYQQPEKELQRQGEQLRDLFLRTKRHLPRIPYSGKLIFRTAMVGLLLVLCIRVGVFYWLDAWKDSRGVATSYLSAYSRNVTVGKAFYDFLDKPEWEKGQANGTDYVVVKGTRGSGRLAVTFMIGIDDTFQVGSVYLNGVDVGVMGREALLCQVFGLSEEETNAQMGKAFVGALFS